MGSGGRPGTVTKAANLELLRALGKQRAAGSAPGAGNAPGAPAAPVKTPDAYPMFASTPEEAQITGKPFSIKKAQLEEAVRNGDDRRARELSADLDGLAAAYAGRQAEQARQSAAAQRAQKRAVVGLKVSEGVKTLAIALVIDVIYWILLRGIFKSMTYNATIESIDKGFPLVPWVLLSLGAFLLVVSAWRGVPSSGGVRIYYFGEPSLVGAIAALFFPITMMGIAYGLGYLINSTMPWFPPETLLYLLVVWPALYLVYLIAQGIRWALLGREVSVRA